MNNPLTSKERRGLLAVAAAALLCVLAGFLVRGCDSTVDSSSAPVVVVDSDSIVGKRIRTDSVVDKTRKKSRKAAKEKRRTEKTYPVRDPLSQPCD